MVVGLVCCIDPVELHWSQHITHARQVIRTVMELKAKKKSYFESGIIPPTK